MRREGTDENNVRMSDVLCDFCRTPWSDDLPVIEGHRGSVICGRCLSVGYAEVVVRGSATAPTGYACTMCLEQRGDRAWASPAFPAVICERCLRLAADTLERDRDWSWRRPGAGA